jgi:hypothetical protein
MGVLPAFLSSCLAEYAQGVGHVFWRAPVFCCVSFFSKQNAHFFFQFFFNNFKKSFLLRVFLSAILCIVGLSAIALAGGRGIRTPLPFFLIFWNHPHRVSLRLGNAIHETRCLVSLFSFTTKCEYRLGASGAGVSIANTFSKD